MIPTTRPTSNPDSTTSSVVSCKGKPHDLQPLQSMLLTSFDHSGEDGQVIFCAALLHTNVYFFQLLYQQARIV